MKNSIDDMQKIFSPSNETGRAVEKEETIKQPIVEIAYRENELFRDLVPKIVEQLHSIKRDTNIHAFPKGTPEEEIKKYFGDENLQKSFEGEELLTDGTCNQEIDYTLEKTMKRKTNLDDFANKIMIHSLLGEKIYEDMQGELTYEVTYKDQINGVKNILKEVIDKNGKPEKLFLVEDKICAHQFNFGSVVGVVKKNVVRIYKEEGGVWLPWTDEKGNDLPENQAKNRATRNSQEFLAVKDKLLSNVLNSIGMSREEYNKFKELEERTKNPELEKEWTDSVIKKLKDALSEIVDKENIKIVPSLKEVEEGDENYVIFDRHAEKSELNNKVALPLPLESIIHHIMKNNLLNVNFDNMEKVIKEEVDKVFKK